MLKRQSKQKDFFDSYVYEHLTLGPDGFVWTFMQDVLVRIDPNDARIHVVGKIDPVGYPTFVGNDEYFAGSERLRRIRNIVPHGAGKTDQKGGCEYLSARFRPPP